ncbi:MAG: hypothetical protein KDI82_09440 [Gammaproteobacteria bacterium]|nr:hypothetical protein [Gammaproteobacteria bacterium]
MSLRLSLFLTFALTVPVTAAELTAVTSDGREVLLHDNGKWEFVRQEATGEPKARLSLENKVDLARGCRLGLRLQNDLPAQIRSLVLRFTAYKDEGVPFETVSRGYSYVKPTNSQYQEISFRGISCDEVRSVEVSAARNCHVGDLTKYSASESRCLELVDVQPSGLLPIATRSTKR